MLGGLGCICDTVKGILVGEIVICSKSNIKGVMDKNVEIRPILLKTLTKVEFLDKMMTITEISKIL